jgi:starvation-inducible outer membrane lipoprotein
MGLPMSKLRTICIWGARKMKKTILAMFLAVALSACASTGEQADEDGETVAASDGEEKQKMRCYRERSTGFRLGGERVCVPVEDD